MIETSGTDEREPCVCGDPSCTIGTSVEDLELGLATVIRLDERRPPLRAEDLL